MKYAVIEKLCNNLLIGKSCWKNVTLPSILCGINVINLTEDDIKGQQTIENSVYTIELFWVHQTMHQTQP